MKRALAAVLIAATTPAVAAPCAKVDRTLSDSLRTQFAPSIEAHLKTQLAPTAQVRAADVLNVFRVGSWHVVQVNTHVTDDPYLFYSKPPSNVSRYVAVWAGGAADSEGAEIAAWVIHNAPGIPTDLATCFAWYVTRGGAE
jgi:hypothetical protein